MCPFYEGSKPILKYFCNASGTSRKIDKAQTEVFCKKDSQYPGCMVYQQANIDRQQKC